MDLNLSAPHVGARTAVDPAAEVAVIVPVYMGEAFIEELVQRLHNTLYHISPHYQIVLVDDRGPDKSWALIEAETLKDHRVLGVRLSRNFGQHPAISAGVAHASAKWYVVMDCDLQDPPEQIAQLYEHACQNGLEVVVAERESSGLGLDRNLGSIMFNSLLRWATEMDVSSRYGNFRIFSDKVAKAFRAYPEQLRFFPALMSHLGFRQAKILLPRSQRQAGKSSYSFTKLARLALENVIAYSEKPLWISIVFSLAISFGSALYGVYIIIFAILSEFSVPGFATIALLISFFGGVNLFILSLVGLYVGRNISETRARPVFIVDTVLRGPSDG